MPVYAVASGKGGVGKTTTAIALAACAGAADRSAVAVDADLGMADLAAFLDLEAGPTLHDVLADDADVGAALVEAEGFDVLPGGTDLDGYADADPAGLRAVVDELADQYDEVVLDVGAGLSHDTVLPLGLADEVVLVSTPDDVSVADATRTRDIADRLDGSLRGVVFTRAVETDLEEFVDDLGVELLGVVPADDTVREAVAVRRPVPAFAPESPAGAAYVDVAATLLDVPTTTVAFGDAGATADPDAPESVGAPDTETNDTEDASATGADSADGRGFLSRLFGR